MQPAHDGQGCNTAKSKASMSLTSNHIRNASFGGLTSQDVLSNSLEYIFLEAQKLDNDGNDVGAPNIAFPELMHHELSALLNFLEKNIKSVLIKTLSILFS